MFLAAALLALTAGGGTASGCSCGIEPADGTALLERSAWVFLGEATDKMHLKREPVASGTSPWGWLYPVKVLRTWKDARAEQAKAERPSVTSYDDCPAEVSVGKRYLFFADRLGTVSRCAEPVAESSAKALIRQLDHAVAQSNNHGAASSQAPQNNALQLTRSHGWFHTWSRFAAPRVVACGGPSQLNAVFDGLPDVPQCPMDGAQCLIGKPAVTAPARKARRRANLGRIVGSQG